MTTEQIEKRIIALKKKSRMIQKQASEQNNKVWKEIESLRRKCIAYKIGSRVLIHKMTLCSDSPQWEKDLLGEVGHITKIASNKLLFTPENKKKHRTQIWLEQDSFLPVASAPQSRLKKT